jgi:hypothetical protein
MVWIGIFRENVFLNVQHANNRIVVELREPFRDSINDYFEYCAERNEKPEKPLYPPMPREWMKAVTSKRAFLSS